MTQPQPQPWPMTDREAARERCENATPGPWYPSMEEGLTYHEIRCFVKKQPIRWANPYSTDEVFAAHARADLPLAIKQIEWLENRVHCNDKYTVEAFESLQLERDAAQAELKRLRLRASIDAAKERP